MLVKVLGVLDFVIGLTLIFSSGIEIPTPVFSVFAGILIIKAGVGLLRDFASWIDLSVGIVFILLTFFPLHWIICLIAGILLIQKGIFSFL